MKNEMIFMWCKCQIQYNEKIPVRAFHGVNMAGFWQADIVRMRMEPLYFSSRKINLMKNTNPARTFQLPFRQVHLDFHTSEHIPDVGAKFSKSQFQEALRLGHVNSITLFAKCHHGLSYHPTKIGRMHPHLKRNLLGEQIEACREIGVRCPIYISAGFDEWMALNHPEWLVIGKNGAGKDPLQAGWNFLRFNSPYLDYLCAQIEEVVNLWPDNDGLFLDIIAPRLDYSRASLLEMRRLGLDPAQDADVTTFSQQVLLEYYRRTNAAARSVRAETHVFHNGGHIPIGAQEFNFFNSHFELESLPTGGWGYDHFPLSARYAITQPREFLGMTGKFHGTWGEFGGFKRPAALRYECAAMLANGSKCSIGDQLHPSGEMNLDTYALIGAAYAEVQAKEAWAKEVSPVVQVAIVSAESHQNEWRGLDASRVNDEGAARMLLELHIPFVILDEHASWDEYEVVILPDGFELSPAKLERAQKFLKAGGRIIAAGSALLNQSKDAFALNPGATLSGRSPSDPDYLVANELSQEVPVKSAIVIEGGAYDIKVESAQVLAERRVPYFNRTWEHFCSHQHAPDSPEIVGPAAIFGNNIVYFAHNLFSQYRSVAQPLYRDFFRAALKLCFPGGLPVQTNLPSVARFNLLEQKQEKRFIAHLLYAPISFRAMKMTWGTPQPLELIEELLPLQNIRVTLKIKQTIKKVMLAPESTELEFTQTGDELSFTVSEFTGHQMVELGY